MVRSPRDEPLHQSGLIFTLAVGPIICGQIYDNIDNAWMVISLMAVGLLGVCLLLSILFTGERPLLQRVLGPFLVEGGGFVNVWEIMAPGEVTLQKPQGQTEPYPNALSIPVPQPAHASHGN